MPLVSLIVPVYGTEKYIEKCARSLFEQSLEDVEFIFVNDATEDSSMEILSRVLACYPERNVVLVNHIVNSGAAKARETGLAIAKGDFIAFCDSDDWVEKDYCLALYETAILSDADIVSCRLIVSNDSDVSFELDASDSSWYGESDVLRATISWEASPHLCRKLFRRELFDNGLVHPTHFHGDDWVLMVQLAYYARKTAFVDKILYNYNFFSFVSHRSQSKENSIKRCHDLEENVRTVCNWLSEKGIENKFKSELVIAKALAKRQLYGQNDEDCRRLWRNTFPEINLSLLFCPKIEKDIKWIHFAIILGVYPVVRGIIRFFRN